jgi:hypothetical protein
MIMKVEDVGEAVVACLEKITLAFARTDCRRSREPSLKMVSLKKGV